MFWAAGRNSRSPHVPSECFSTRREIHINKRNICLYRPRRWMEHGFLSKINNSNSKISSGYFMDAGRFSSWITKTFSCKFAFLQEGGEPALLFVRFVFCFFFSTLHIFEPNCFCLQWTPITPHAVLLLSGVELMQCGPHETSLRTLYAPKMCAFFSFPPSLFCVLCVHNYIRMFQNVLRIYYI